MYIWVREVLFFFNDGLVFFPFPFLNFSPRPSCQHKGRFGKKNKIISGFSYLQLKLFSVFIPPMSCIGYDISWNESRGKAMIGHRDFHSCCRGECVKPH